MFERDKVFHDLVPHTVQALLQTTGLLPFPSFTPHHSTLRHTLKWILRTWSSLILLVYGYFYAIELVIFTRTFKSELAHLEFFTMILSVYRQYFFLMPLPLLLSLLIRARAVPRIFNSIETALTDILLESQRKTFFLDRVLVLVALGATLSLSLVVGVLAVTIGSVYCFYEGVKLMLAEIQKVFPEVGWDSEQAVVIVPGE
ncbi:hypothetical protein BV898_06275 [Hypsibius exemplaris]|uniref:Uncharacterized protein n=1 Tax=Hypsibius exemplaris TaxID=2072580 RepID=A0A1W0WX40_HYPEX|nr:hypothetical protein BV898_06275 [Hypsibius exemplaris]